MKKTIITTTLILGLALTGMAQLAGGGLFQRGITDEEFYGMGYASSYRNGMPLLPLHGYNDNQNAPVGGGIAVLTALGAAYLIGKKRREE